MLVPVAIIPQWHNFDYNKSESCRKNMWFEKNKPWANKEVSLLAYSKHKPQDLFED